MSPIQRHPETNEPIRNLHDYDRAVAELAGALPPLPDGAVPAEVIDLPGTPQAERNARARELQAKARAIGERLTARSGHVDIHDIPDDPHADLGGGLHTLRREGALPVAGDIVSRTVFRGGKLYQQVRLQGREILVPVNEQSDSSFEADVAKAEDALRRGGGNAVRRSSKSGKIR